MQNNKHPVIPAKAGIQNGPDPHLHGDDNLLVLNFKRLML